MITSRQKKLLKARAHPLKPVVITGAGGISAAVLAEIDRALEHHELIKVRINADTAEQRAAWSHEIGTELNAETVQTVGHIVTLYRAKPPGATHPRPASRKQARYTGPSRSRTP